MPFVSWPIREKSRFWTSNRQTVKYFYQAFLTAAKIKGMPDRRLYRSVSGSLEEQEMLWKHEPTGQYFHSFFKSSQTSMSCSSVKRRNKLPISFGKFRDKKENILFSLIIRMSVLLALAIITSKVCATCSSAFLLSFRNVIWNQSSHLFCLGHFQILYRKVRWFFPCLWLL